jgi:hypothetical protein
VENSKFIEIPVYWVFHKCLSQVNQIFIRKYVPFDAAAGKFHHHTITSNGDVVDKRLPLSHTDS